ncbi:TPA: hypothetical protein ACLZEB_001182 [Streptococcus pneumoniae]
MNDNQLKVLKWMTESGTFQDAIIELEGEYESIPDAVYEAYDNINQKEKLEVIHKATEILLEELH